MLPSLDGFCRSFLLVCLVLAIMGCRRVVNTLPVAEDQTVGTDEDAALAITLTASDNDGDPLSWHIDTQPSHGVLTGAAPDLTYTPDADFNGTDTFEFHVNDGKDDSAIATVTVSVSPIQDIWHVDADVAASGDGRTWGGAFKDLQEALSAAYSGDEIWVAEGTYVPADDGDRTRSFVLVPGAAVYGGFNGTEADRSPRDPDAHVTVLSGDLNGDDGAGGDNSENSYHVVVGADDAVLDGFTITAGNSDGPGYPDNFHCGGGLFINRNTCVSLADCVLTGNSADYGGAISNSYAVLEVRDCVFSGNTATGGGGGIRNSGASLVAVNCTFSGNNGLNYAGAITNEFDGIIRAAGCTFEANSGTYDGGGVYIYWAVGFIDRCFFVDNDANHGGGASVRGGRSHVQQLRVFLQPIRFPRRRY